MPALPGGSLAASALPRADLVATVVAAPAAADGELAGLHPGVRWLEVRADRTGDLDPERLRRHFRGELLYTLRSAAEGGRFAGSAAARRERLLRAAQRYDLVDLEAERDTVSELLARIPPHRRVLSWHGPAATSGALAERFARMARVPARLYRVKPAGLRASDGLVPLALLRTLGRDDVAAYATGPATLWSRLLAPRLGAPVCFARLGGPDDGAGNPTVAELARDYGLPELPPLRELYGIVGGSVGGSASPRLHNGAYRALRVAALYLPFQVDDFERCWPRLVAGLRALGLPLRGATVTSPHKEAALAAAGGASPLARRAGAANLLVRAGGGWHADTTDADGVVRTLARAGVDPGGRPAAVVGCGGAGRAAAAGLAAAGARVTLCNRGERRGAYAARLLGLPFVPLECFDPGGQAVVVHATSLDGEPPFQVERLDPGAAVVDLVYRRRPTPLARAALARGHPIVTGHDVLAVEVRRQFRLMTGQRLPTGLADAGGSR